MLTSRQIKRASEKGTFSATLAMVSAKEGEDGLDGLIDAQQRLGVWLKVIIDVVSC
jgi:hypothetical protein